MINIAFAGMRHGHIFALYNMVKENPNFNLKGAYEEDKDGKAWAEGMGAEFNYNSLEELLSDKEVDAVALGGCFADRGGVAIKALRAGKHVIADKPLCTSLEELDEIEKLSKETGKKVSCMFTMRYDSKILSVKKLVESGALGEIVNISFGGQHPLMYGRRPDWYFEDGKYGGLINDIGIHAMDILPFALGINVKEVNAARCWNKYATDHPEFKDCGQFMLTADNGAGILGDVSYAIPDGVEFSLPYYWQFYVWGTKGMISFSLNEKETVYYLAGDKEPKKLENVEVEFDYLTDVYRLINGEKDVVLTTEETIKSMRKTLEIQAFSER